MLKKVIPIVVACLLTMALLPACVAPATPTSPTPKTPKLPEKIKIGSIMCLSGALAGMGDKISKGVKMAVDEINAAGGIDGRSVKLLMEDSKTTSKGGLEAFKKLVEVNGVKVVVGPMISGAVMAVGPYAKKRGVVFVSPSSTGIKIRKQPWKKGICFRTCPPDILQAAAMSKIAVNKGFDKVAIMVMDNVYGVGIGKKVKENLQKAGVDVVGFVKYDPKKLDYRTELGAIKGKNPDCVVHVGYYDDSAVVFRQASEMGLGKIQWISAEGVYGMDFTISKTADKFMENSVIGTALTTVGPRYKKFCTDYKKKFGVEPSVYADTAYDSTKMVAKAIEKAGVYKGVKIGDALWEVGKEYKGASGTIKFDDVGDRASATFKVWKVVKAPEKKPPYKFAKIKLTKVK